MGSYGDRWLRCTWCWRWGKCLPDEYLNGADPLIDIDMVGVLCERCFALEEPPWWPNNRQRYVMKLRQMRLLPLPLKDKGVDELIANFLAANTE